MSRSALAAALLVAGLAAARPLPAQRHVPGGDPGFPRVRYADSLESPNDRCMVRGSKLKPGIQPVYVNGVPLGFC